MKWNAWDLFAWPLIRPSLIAPAVLFALGSLLIGHLVEFTTLLFQRIPHLIG